MYQNVDLHQISNINALPEELQIYVRDQKVNERIRKAEEENKILRQKERELLEIIKKNGKLFYLNKYKTPLTPLLKMFRRD